MDKICIKSATASNEKAHIRFVLMMGSSIYKTFPMSYPLKNQITMKNVIVWELGKFLHNRKSKQPLVLALPSHCVIFSKLTEIDETYEEKHFKPLSIKNKWKGIFCYL